MLQDAQSCGSASSDGDVLAPGNNHKRFQGCTVVRHVRDNKGQTSRGQTNGQLAVNMRVRVYPGTDAECRGALVEDFGDLAGHAVEIGVHRIADPARRWAVQLDTGSLVFADSGQLVPEECCVTARSGRRRG
jgi:hypothetical protein